MVRREILIPGILRRVKQSGTMETLRPYASQLVECVNEAGAGNGYEGMSVAEISAACIILMGWK